MDRLKAALFDLDGVVFNTEPQYTDFWGTQFREFYPDKPNLENEIKGQTLIQIYDRYFSEDLQAKRVLITERLNLFEKQMAFDYVDGFKAFVVDLHNHGVKTAVVTSSNVSKMNVVYEKHPDFKQLFDVIFTAEDFCRSKPAPDCYLNAAQRLEVTPAECVVFEDSFNGLKSGRAAHMAIVGLATTNPEEVVASYSDVVIRDYRNLDYERLNGLFSKLK